MGGWVTLLLFAPAPTDTVCCGSVANAVGRCAVGDDAITADGAGDEDDCGGSSFSGDCGAPTATAAKDGLIGDVAIML